MLEITDQKRVRTIALNRPEALNAFNEALYNATCTALRDAADDEDTAVVSITGLGFAGLIAALTDSPKPLVCAVNGVGLGIGVTILGFADLAIMSTKARLKCPFTSLGVAPEAASSYLMPTLVGRQNAAWMLMSSEWISADQALAMGLVVGLCEPDSLLAEATRYAEVIAQHPISSLMAVKRAVAAPYLKDIVEARAREDASFAELMGASANTEALRRFTDRRRDEES